MNRPRAVNHDLGDQILERLMNATHLLVPVKASGGFFGHAPATLKETQPTFRGTWVLRDPDSRIIARQKPKSIPRSLGRPVVAATVNSSVHDEPPPAPPSLIVVQIDWAEDEGALEKMPARFYRLKPGQTKMEENMNINLLELGE